MLWTKADKWSYMDCKGIETKRRDNCLWVKNTLQKSLDHLLIDGDPTLAKSFIQNSIRRLMANKVDISELVISKQMKKIESYTNKQPHTELAIRMEKRKPGSAPATGDRVPFVYIKKGKKAKAHEKSEDPLYVLENDLPIDTDHYINTQLKKPIERLFEPILGDKTSSLFHGDHSRTVKKTFRGKQTKGAAGFMSSFVVIKAKCLRCSAKLKDSEKTVCRKCKPYEGEVYLQKMQDLKHFQKNFTDLWTTCQRCTGSLCQEVLCSNNSCPIFYRRVKARKDLEITQEQVRKFEL